MGIELVLQYLVSEVYDRNERVVGMLDGVDCELG